MQSDPVFRQNSPGPRIASGAGRLLAQCELLLVSSDYAMVTIFARACQELGVRLESVHSITAAGDVVKKRKVDGIVVDMRMVGAVALMEELRDGGSSRSAVIFACAENYVESEAALNAGANLLIQKPIVQEDLIALLTASAPMLD